jgi:tRNA(fMet)-specific endonuclease VapC
LGLILDSSVLIAAERLGHTAYQILDEIRHRAGDQEIAVSVITVLELAHGLSRANTSERLNHRQRFLDELIAGVPVFPVTIPIALRAGRIEGQLRAAGTRVALSDLLIASTALELDFDVATNNLRHFALIPGVRVQGL